MAFMPADGSWTKVQIPTKSSTVYTQGMILCNDGTDNVVSTTSSVNNWCICAEDKASVANTNPISVWVPRSPYAKFYGDVGSGTPAVANFGGPSDIASGGLTTAHGTTTHKQLINAGYISATRQLYRLNNGTVAS